jgi:regulator of sigma E protease
LEILITLYTIAKVAVGLGLVIFIHELGHFLMAKWNGVKVEKFSIGFGPTVLGFRRGETDYVIAALPLGGFVKMLGEGLEDEQNKSTDPRAYPNKSVSARMAIISAGVVMNLFLAYFCFVYYYSYPHEEQPANLGIVAAGSPAYEAGLRAGDEIVAIDDRRDLGWNDLLQKVLFSSEGQVLHFQVKRPGQDKLMDLDLVARREATGDRPTVGIVYSSSLEMVDLDPPAGMAKPPKYAPIEARERQSKVDVLVAAAPAGETTSPLSGVDAYDRLLARYRDRPITHQIERRPILPSGEHGPRLDKFELTTPPTHFRTLGLRLTIDPINAVRRDSIAEAAGFRKGDRILKVDGRADIDPIELPWICHDHAGKPMKFEVGRQAENGEYKVQTLTATPDDTPPRARLIFANEPVDLAGLGLSYPIRTYVAAVEPNSDAERAKIKPGDVITSMNVNLAPTKDKNGKLVPDPKSPITLEFKDGSTSWFHAFAALQERPVVYVELFLNGSKKGVTLVPKNHPTWYNPDRGILFQAQIRTVPGETLAQAVRSGYDQTIKNIGMVYATFRSLAQRRVSFKHVGGPIMIFEVGYGAAGSGLNVLVFFLGILSVNLAVLNFLPVPPLDGGQMVFLIAEKVRGRPLPDTAVLAGTYFGLFLVLCLMVFVTYQDIFRLVTGWWS